MNDKESHSAPRSEDGHADDVKEGSDAPRPLTLSRTYVTPPVPSSAISKDQNFMHGRAHGGGPWATATVHDRGRGHFDFKREESIIGRRTRDWQVTAPLLDNRGGRRRRRSVARSAIKVSFHPADRPPDRVMPGMRVIVRRRP